MIDRGRSAGSKCREANPDAASTKFAAKRRIEGPARTYLPVKRAGGDRLAVWAKFAAVDLALWRTLSQSGQVIGGLPNDAGRGGEQQRSYDERF